MNLADPDDDEGEEEIEQATLPSDRTLEKEYEDGRLRFGQNRNDFFLPHVLGPVDKPRPDADAAEQDESHEAGGELVISGGDAALLLEMPNEALNP